MATDFLYGTRPGAIALLTTELDALATAGVTAAGPAITPGTTTNLTSRIMWGDLLFKLASSSSALTAASYLNVYFLTAVDGTNYPKLSGANLAKNNYYVGTIRLYPASLTTEAIFESITRIAIPNCPFKAVLENQSGVTLPASGNTLDLYPQATQY